MHVLIRGILWMSKLEVLIKGRGGDVTWDVRLIMGVFFRRGKRRGDNRKKPE